MSGHKQHSQQTPPRFRIGKRAFEHGAEAGKGECARINAYMQKHFNDILSFLSRFLTVLERPTKTLSCCSAAALKLLSRRQRKGLASHCSHFQKPPNLH